VEKNPLNKIYRGICVILAAYYFFILLWERTILWISNAPSLLVITALMTIATYPEKNLQLSRNKWPRIILVLGLLGLVLDIFALYLRQDYEFDREAVIIFVITFFILIYGLIRNADST